MPGLKVFDGSSWRATGVEDSQWDILSATAGGTVVNLSWPTAGGSPASYEINLDNSVINVGNTTSYTVTGLTIGQSYSFKVRPVYSDGSTGGWSYFKNSGPAGFNNATGGTVTTVPNYNGTGQTWKVHKFTSSGTFTVTENYGFHQFNVLVVGGGGGGGASGGGSDRAGQYYRGGGGGGGGYRTSSISLAVASHTVTVGAGAAGTAVSNTGTNRGGNSSIGTITSTGGGGGNWLLTGGTGGSGGGGGLGENGNIAGAGGAGNTPSTSPSQGNNGAGSGGGGGGANSAASGTTGGSGKTTDISGSTETYSAGGNASPGTGGANTGKGGGSGGFVYAPSTPSGSSGGSGIVIIAYQIG